MSRKKLTGETEAPVENVHTIGRDPAADVPIEEFMSAPAMLNLKRGPATTSGSGNV